MSSLIEGFSYDIFISYRQKDNKYDGWVTDFAENLKRELEATFKEEVSVYFDINPHDGLLETHDVDASLKEKLKCLVFIPVISRTYCDPKSFAWEHEFKAFIDHASADRFGLKVTLKDGNVSSRVLPLRIHDLDPADIKLCESALGTVLRGVEFIYKSAGVNRPLRATEDNPHDNLNHTIYRDQINKVALAVKAIIEGMQEAENRAPSEQVAEEGPERLTVKKTASGKTAPRSWLVRALLMILSVVVVITVIFIFSGSTTIPFERRDWVVITDFENTTGDEIFDKSLYTAFSLTANQSRYVNIFPRQRMRETLMRMKENPDMFIDNRTGREIAARENIDIYIVPGISQVGDRFVINASINETKTGNLLKAEVLYAQDRNEILPALDRLSKKIRRSLGESRYTISTQDKPLSKVTTASLEALKLYSMGIACHYRLDFIGARDYYEKALKADTGFTAARASLGNILIEQFQSDEGKELLRQAVRSVNNLTDKEKYGILGFYAVNVEKDIQKGVEYTERLTGLYPDDPAYHNNLGYYYQLLGRYQDALEEYKAAIRINPRQTLTYGGILWLYLTYLGDPDSSLVWAEKMIADNPQNGWSYTYLGSAWICFDSITLAEAAFEKARELSPRSTFNLFRLAHTYRLLGKYDQAIDVLREIPSINKNETLSAWYDMGVNYRLLGRDAEANRYFTDFRREATRDWMQNYPDDAATYLSLGSVAARMGDMEYSEKMLQKAVSIDSTEHSLIAELLCLQGKVPEAIDQLRKALEAGYRDLSWLRLNADLQALRYDVRFRNLLDQYFFNN